MRSDRSTQYTLMDLGVTKPLYAVERQEAERVFDLRMRKVRERIEQLSLAMEADGVKLTRDDKGLDALDGWFRSLLRSAREQSPGEMPIVIFSLINDIGLFLGDVIVERCPTLRWALCKGDKREAAYQKHVIIGFRNVSDPDYYIDVDGVVATYALKLFAEKERRKSLFTDLVRTAEKRS